MLLVVALVGAITFLVMMQPAAKAPVGPIQGPPAPVENGCDYMIPPEESGLTPEIFLNLKEEEVKELTFGVTTRLHAECHEGKLGYFIAKPDPDCIPESVLITPDGGWGCYIDTSENPSVEIWTSLISWGWKWPNGKPENWYEPEMQIPWPPTPSPEGTENG